jgi:hypothetical protein
MVRTLMWVPRYRCRKRRQVPAQWSVCVKSELDNGCLA